MKPDLSKVRSFTPAQLAEWRKYGTKGPPKPRVAKPKKVKRKKRNKQGTKMPGRKVVVACISLRPELKIQAERWIGGGNFSRACTIALEAFLADLLEKAKNM